MRVKKLFKSLGVVVVATAMVIASAPVAYAANAASMVVTPYITTEKKADQMSGVWDLELPAAKLLEPMASQIESLAKTGAYPHGRDGKNKIAYIRYKVVFPEGTTPDVSSIVINNKASFVYGNGITYTQDGQTVNFRIPLNDVNWQQIFDLYKNDIADPSSHILSCKIPYTIANKSALLEEISSSGDFAFYPGGFQAALGYGLKEFFTDESFVRVGGGSATSTSEVIEVPDKFDIGTVDLKGYGSVEGVDKVEGGVFDGRYPYNPKDPYFVVAAHLNNGIVKDTLKDMIGTTSVTADKVNLGDVDGTFIATIELGKLNVTADSPYQLDGSNGTYSVTDHQVITSENGNVLKVTMKLNNPEQIKTLHDLDVALNNADSDLKLTFHVGTPTENLVDVPGTFNGSFEAKASLADFPEIDGIPFIMKYVSDGSIKLFKPISANFYPDDSEHGSVSVPSVVLAPDTDHGADFTPSSVATPKDGYRFVNWTHNGKVVSTDPELKLQKDPEETMWYGHEGDYIAHFEKIPSRKDNKNMPSKKSSPKKLSPKTGDATNIGLIAVMSVAGLALVIKSKENSVN